MELVFLILTLAVMVVGLVGTIIPVIPSIPIIYGAFAIYGLGTGWRDYGWGFMAAFGVLTVAMIVLDYVAGAVGAKKYGASRVGIIGSIIGTAVGVIFFNIPGLILGPFVGALLGELCLGRTYRDALRSGWGAFLGFLAGAFFKMIAAFVMIATFVWKIAM